MKVFEIVNLRLMQASDHKVWTQSIWIATLGQIRGLYAESQCNVNSNIEEHKLELII